MGINKVINQPRKSHVVLARVLAYVLQDQKVIEGYLYINGPFPYAVVDSKKLYDTWVSEKKLWGKDNGRMYEHHVISFHKDEKITAKQVLDIAKKFCEKFFASFQYIITVHQDKDHLHAHIVVNSVSFIDGYKYHQKKYDLELQKRYTNRLCAFLGFKVPEKGKHFDGTDRDASEITAWNKNKYGQLKKDSNSNITRCANDILLVRDKSLDKEQFMEFMEDFGWTTTWNTSKKRIVFTDKENNKVSNRNLSQTFTTIDFSMEALEKVFLKNQEREMEKENELTPYYDSIVDYISNYDKPSKPANDSDKQNNSPSLENSPRENEEESKIEDMEPMDNNDLEDIDF